MCVSPLLLLHSFTSLLAVSAVEDECFTVCIVRLRQNVKSKCGTVYLWVQGVERWMAESQIVSCFAGVLTQELWRM